ncbi:hypothetical protein B7P43_G17762, partial [Cryptotermes secundus]
DSDQRSRTSSASQNADVIEKVRTLIMEDCHLTIWEVADEVGISRGSAKMILTEDVGMQRVAAKFFPSCFCQSGNNSALRSCRTCLFITPDPGFPDQVRQTPYSPDMAPCDFWLFPRLERLLKGRWAKCVESQGAYFEGD